MAAKYRFKTIMVTDRNREEVTKFRDGLKTEEFGRVTDKELFEAIWNLVDYDDVKAYILKRKGIIKANKEREKLEKLKKELDAATAALETDTDEEAVEATA